MISIQIADDRFTTKTAMNILPTFTPDYAIPPGETILETIEELEITQKELAHRMRIPVKTINEIIQGQAPLTQEIASELERVTHVPSSLWNNLESQYRKSLHFIS